MIIPLSHESGEVRRQPWVTYGIILSCVLVFLATNVLNRDAHPDPGRLLEDAVEYWSAHPYLEAPPRLTEMTGDRGGALREEFHSVWEAAGKPRVPASTLERERERLDQLTEWAFAAREEHPWFRFGLIASAPTAVGLFGHMFLHAGWLHLLFNMLYLFLTGPFIEDRWGRALYALFYLAAGVSAAALFVGRYPEFDLPLIGASGAVAGAMGAFLVCFARTKIRFFYWFVVFFGTFSAPAWLILPLWFAGELFSAKLVDALGAGGGGVAYWAHVGGFLFGVVGAVLIRFSGIEQRLTKKLGGEWVCDHDSIHAEVIAAREEGRPEEALELLRFALEADRHDPDLALAFFETAAGLGRLEEGSAVLGPVLWREVKAGEREVAVTHWLALCGAGARAPGDPPLMLRLAGWLRDAENAAAASAVLQCVLDACPGDPVVAMRVARLARSLDPLLALEAAELALESPGLEPAERQALEAIAAGAGERIHQSPIALESPVASGPSFEPEEELDHGAVDLGAISAEPEPEDLVADRVGAPEFDRGVVDLSEISAEAEQASDPTERFDPSQETLAHAGFGDGSELFDEQRADLSEKEEPEPCGPAILRTLRVIDAIPRELDEAALWLEVEGRGRTRLPWARVDAVAAAGVHGLSRKAVILIDLALDWSAEGNSPLTVLRLRSDRYDPRTLVANAHSPLQAIAEFVSVLIARTRAVPLPDPGSARGEPFRIFRDLAGYEEKVLRAQRPAVDDIFEA